MASEQPQAREHFYAVVLPSRALGVMAVQAPSDAQIQAIWDQTCREDGPATPGWSRHLRFARAVLALGVTVGPTGREPELLQDCDRKLSRALAGTPDARLHAREAATAAGVAVGPDLQIGAAAIQDADSERRAQVLDAQGKTAVDSRCSSRDSTKTAAGVAVSQPQEEKSK